MNRALLIVLPPVTASVIVLSIAGVSASVWTMHARTALAFAAAARAWTAALTVAVIALITAWAFTRPDPLLSVPWVEGVFVLALGHSAIAGIVVSACAVAFITSLALASRSGPRWLAGVAAYYAVLFAGSIAGLTPAPLIGFGAGPWLGFGLLVATAGSARAITER